MLALKYNRDILLCSGLASTLDTPLVCKRNGTIQTKCGQFEGDVLLYSFHSHRRIICYIAFFLDDILLGG